MMGQRRSALPAVLLVGAVLAYCSQFLRGGFVGGSSRRDSRVSKLARSGVDKAMKERIVSVQKTGALTDCMRMVAAAKVRRAQDGVLKARPFSEELTGMIKGLVKKLKGSGLEAELPMLRVPDEVKNVAIAIVMADRGLCGGYNALMVRKVEERVKALNDEGITPKLIYIGKKCKQLLPGRLQDVKYNETAKIFQMPDSISSKAASEISDEIRSFFLSGEVDKVEVIYTKFVNLLKYDPQVRTVLPLSPTGIEDPEDETFVVTSEDGKLKVDKKKSTPTKAKEIEADVIFDQPPETILNSMLPLYLNSQILSMLYDAQASELGARMTAMKAATDNAKELVEKLTTIYNKKRQAAITAEISEINSGSLALEDGAAGKGGAPLGVFDNEGTVEEDFLKELEDGSLPDAPQPPLLEGETAEVLS